MRRREVRRGSLSLKTTGPFKKEQKEKKGTDGKHTGVYAERRVHNTKCYFIRRLGSITYFWSKPRRETLKRQNIAFLGCFSTEKRGLGGLVGTETAVKSGLGPDLWQEGPTGFRCKCRTKGFTSV